MPQYIYSDDERKQRIKWILGGLLVAFIVGWVVGYGVGKDASDEQVYESGKSAGILIGYERGELAGIDKGLKRGEIRGRAIGGKIGYALGFSDKVNGRPNALERVDNNTLGTERYASRSIYLGVVSSIAVLFTLWWGPVVYLATPRPRTLISRDRSRTSVYLFGAKLIASGIVLFLAWLVLPSYWLARQSSDLVDKTRIEATSGFIGLIAAILIGSLIEWSMADARRTVAWQLVWVAVMPVGVYQLVGCVWAATTVHSAFAVKMLQLSTGIAIGLAVQRTYMLLKPRPVPRIKPEFA